MKITRIHIPVRDLIEGYIDKTDTTNEVVGLGGRLEIRPKYQRQFLYTDKKREAVADTVYHGFPLSIMYYAKHEDGTYEIIDGQQRTISICQYCMGEFSIIGDAGSPIYFHNMSADEKKRFLDYELDVYVCEGTDDEKLAWFRRINIQGMPLTEQELRNAIYAGEGLSDAKLKFSRNNCAASRIGKDYMSGNPIRQDYLEKVLSWMASRENTSLEKYMAEHQHKSDADEQWQYFQAVIDWVKRLFPYYRKEMKSVEWGLLYNKYSCHYFSSSDLEEKVKRLMADDDITNKKGIYSYVLGEPEKVLSIRQFTENQKREAYERQGGICPYCASEGGPNATKKWDITEMEADHIEPWHSGGKTISENCQMLCKAHNRAKSGV